MFNTYTNYFDFWYNKRKFEEKIDPIIIIDQISCELSYLDILDADIHCILSLD